MLSIESNLLIDVSFRSLVRRLFDVKASCDGSSEAGFKTLDDAIPRLMAYHMYQSDRFEDRWHSDEYVAKRAKGMRLFVPASC